MRGIDELVKGAHERDLRFQLIGGHALAAYGVTRQTGDVDLLIDEADTPQWRELIAHLGYSAYHVHRAFIQFSPPDKQTWPIDLMLVSHQTFAQMWEQSRSWRLAQHELRIPAPKHLLALKLHALKQDPKRRSKDIDDMIGVIRHEAMDVTGDEFKQLCEKYGSKEIYEDIYQRWLNH